MADKEKRNKSLLEKQIRSQVKAEENAFRIVEKLALIDCTSETELEKMVNFIMPGHYADITEERFISKICGYPLCDKKMEKIPKQKYHISTKTNKVYDISQGKCFCSGACYKASKFLEAQIPTSPLWMREGPLTKITFLQRDEREGSYEGRDLTGDPLFQTIKLTEEEIEKPGKDEHIPNASELEDDVTSLEDTFEDDQPYFDSPNDETSATEQPSAMEQNSENSNLSYNVKEKVEGGSAKKIRSSVENNRDIVAHLCNVLQEWYSSETKLLLSHGLLIPTGAAKSDSGTTVMTDRTQQARQFLMREPEWKKKIREEKEISSNDVMPKSDSVERLTEIMEQNLKTDDTKAMAEEEPRKSVLPPIDSRSQMTIRRRIVSQKLQSCFSELVPSFGLTFADVSSELNSLIKTFRLSSQNIVLKPKEWSVLSLVLLQVLIKPDDDTRMTTEERHEVVSSKLQNLSIPCEDFCKIEAVLLPKTEGPICTDEKNSDNCDFEELD